MAKRKAEKHSATTPAPERLGDRMRIARGDSSREQAAALIGTHETTLGNYERSEREPPASILIALCEKFGCEPAWLLLGRGPQFPAAPKPAAPLAYDAEKMQVALQIAEELDKAGRLPPEKEKHVWATQLYEFFMQRD